jgi:hypothetical protein
MDCANVKGARNTSAGIDICATDAYFSLSKLFTNRRAGKMAALLAWF